MPEFRCDAAYLSGVFSELRIIDKYKFPSTAGTADLCATINRFSPGKYAHDLRDELVGEARDLDGATEAVIRILSAEISRRNESTAPDFRTYALQEFGIDPNQAIAMMNGLRSAFRKAADHMQTVLPITGKTSAAKPWHTYVERHATVFVHAMATTNPGFVRGIDEAMMCRFIARVANDKGDGPVTPAAIVQFLDRRRTSDQ